MDKIILEFKKGPKEGKQVKIRNGFMLGRDMECEIFIDDSSISKRHAMFEISGTQAVVKDVGSSNGTFVNGKKVQKAVLNHNDEVSFGRTTAKVVFEGMPAAALAVKSQAEQLPSSNAGGKEEDKKKKKSFKPLIFVFVIGVALLLFMVVIKAVIGGRQSTAPVELKYKDFHDIKNRYIIEVPLGWKSVTRSNTYFRNSGAFDRIWVTFMGKVEGRRIFFVIDRLEGFSYDLDIDSLVDFSSATYPRYAAGPRKKVSTRDVSISNIPAKVIESYSVDPRTKAVTRYFEIYALVKDYLVIERKKIHYAIPHQTRYVLTMEASDYLYTRMSGFLEKILSSFEIKPSETPEGAITDVTRSQLFDMYEDKIKRAEYLLERTTIDVGNQFKALQDYKSAIWIVIEYEDLGGASKYRKALIRKTVRLNADLNKKWQSYKFNIKKGYALKDRNFIAESAKKIMELFPDPENYKHIDAKREYNQFKKR